MGSIGSIFSQSFPSKPTWTQKDMPDLTGQIMIVTGGNTGIGKETVKALLSHNAKVYIATRTQSRAEGAIEELKAATGKEAYFLKLDLADLKSIKAAVEEFTSKETQLHVLFNSGGVMAPPKDQLTADGYDLQFGTNALGHFYFTKLLLPTLISTAKATPGGRARVVNTSSSAVYLVSGLKFDTFRDGPARRKRSQELLYAQSKFANVVFSNELARRYGNDGILSISLNPGNIRTELQRHLSGVQARIIDWMLYPVEFGAISQLWAGTSPEALNAQGKFVIPWAKLGKPTKQTGDPALGRELWEWMEEQVATV